MSVGAVNKTDAHYAQLFGKVQNLISSKKINIYVFDKNMDGKLSKKELQEALTLIPNMKVSQGIVSLNEVDKNKRVVKTTRKIITGELLNTTNYEYNEKGQKIKEICNGSYGSSVTSYGYHENGQLKTSSTKTADGKTVTLKYSDNGQFVGMQ